MVKLPKVEKLVKDILTSRKNANKVIELINLLETDETEEVLSVIINGLTEFFVTAIKNEELQEEKSEDETMGKYRAWVRERYTELSDALMSLLGADRPIAVQSASLDGLVKLHAAEAEVLGTDFCNHKGYLTEIVHLILCGRSDGLLELMSQYWEYDDIRLATLEIFPDHFENVLKEAATVGQDQALLNVFFFTKSISEHMPLDVSKEHCNMYLTVENMPQKLYDIDNHRLVFSQAWLDFLKQDLSENLFKRVLVLLEKSIIPNFHSPCVLADFLMRSFQQGGGIALLSLHGLFILIDEHNLEYPQFYTNLYAMIHPRIFEAKYQSRFFYLLKIFLSSTHLPAYLVAAFAKKLARLTLVTPTYAQELILTFIFNLIERNPSIQFLVNATGKTTQKDIQNDPYNATETDPAQCNVMASSLWELGALKQHYLPAVVKAADENRTKKRPYLHDLLDTSFEDTFKNMAEKNVVEAPMNHVPPEGMFGGFEDMVSELWAV